MITFLKKRSYDLVCMFVTQLAISLFGLALAFAVPVNQAPLRIGTSIFSVLFYLFIIYTNNNCRSRLNSPILFPYHPFFSPNSNDLSFDTKLTCP